MRVSLFRPARLALTAVLLAAVALLGFSAPASATGAAAPRYYLALGDSLAAGYQTLPGGGHVTGRGYAQDIARTLAARAAGAGQPFDFVGLGCPGETTGSMIDGPCPYPHSYTGSQLAEAERFLRLHRDDRVVVTLDIGANDVDGCLTDGNIDLGCAVSGVGKVGSGLNTILGRLKAAAGPQTRIVGMNLYDPFLAAWLTGTQGKAAATLSVPLADTLNATIGLTDAAHGVPTADVASAFRTNSFLPPTALNGQRVPLNVARIMQWTNMARGDIHANDTGYQAIADAFLKKI
ncbi:SGNH/GDSL hydrolase family protein [Streptomyces sp. SID10853]|uniref:SGNH/GDSL hydrolase family protein n=1 Tax=Streptomyces sp. SID10853 TaxID=2706028 RepID=UPI0013C1D3D4|nr:SGNH/GDSL hydrolase family protein [Streptomyces sp. SID10853]NDZ80775.1 SGNH/GDSL hydrolase family protein [Streptomyces sp. SID10853]